MIPSRQDILARLFDRQYGQAIVRNDLRGELVEEIVGAALAPDWRLCGGDWAAFDLEHVTTGLKLQVKQSAAKQTWAAPSTGISSPRFSIASKTGRYEGSLWIDEVSRNAEIFVFAWHGIIDETCDHACSAQWEFFVVTESILPNQKSISLPHIMRLSDSYSFADLKIAVGVVSKALL